MSSAPEAAPRRLTRRELGRATLARQLLLARAPIGAVEALTRLAGMQAQEARPPFIGLWSRLEDFCHGDLAGALRSGAALRGPLFRATLHLVSDADWAVFRPPCQPALTRAMRALGQRAEAVDVETVAATARALLEERPRTARELRTLLHQAFPETDERALGYAMRTHLPLVMVATADRWGFPRDAQLRLAEPASASQDPKELLRRYLGAYGPASVADAQEWSGLQGLAASFEAMRGTLVCFTDERGRELFDLPDAPRPSAAVSAPPRFLPEFDSLALAHADRSRLIADEHRKYLTTRNLRVNATVLHDGEVCATWTVTRRAKAATLEITPFHSLSAEAEQALEAEGLALLKASESGGTTLSVTALAPLKD